MKQYQVVFVETQGHVLDDARLKLLGKHPDWRILLMIDGDAAIKLIAQRSASLVMANFGVDRRACETFFRELRDNYPEIIRVGLVDDYKKAELGDTLEYAHECIAASCDSSQFETVIARGLTVSERTRKNARLAKLISNLKNLPTPPSLYFDIRDELESPTGDSHSIAQVIAKDPATAAKLLMVANSGFYATPRTIFDLHEAITLLGFEMVSALVLATHLFDQLPLPGVNMDVLWVHSLAVARLAKEIAVQEGCSRSSASVCGVAGLLHDLGELIFLSNASESYYGMVRHSGGDERALLQMELEQFGVGHPELGAHILSLWGLPEEIVQAVAYHHGGVDRPFSDEPLPSKVVCLAEWLLQTHNLASEPDLTGTCLAGNPLMRSHQMEVWRKILDRLVDQGTIREPFNPAQELFG